MPNTQHFAAGTPFVLAQWDPAAAAWRAVGDASVSGDERTIQGSIDVTGALLGNSGLFGGVLPIVGEEAQCDVLVLALPVAGTGYDVPRFARDLAEFQRRYGVPSALAAPQAAVREPFAAAQPYSQAATVLTSAR